MSLGFRAKGLAARLGRPRLAPPPGSTLCETNGCGGPRVWLVAQGRQIKNVCGRCRDELIGVYGWRLEL